MRLHRFIGNFDFTKKPLRVSDKKLTEQLKNVLRLKAGNQIILADGKLNEATAKIVSLEKDVAELEILEITKNTNEPTFHTILYCSILKKENFELVVQKATEVGVKEIVPMLAQRTVKLNLKRDRLEKIIREAAEQSGRGHLPALGEVVSFEEAMAHAKDNNANLFLEPERAMISLERLKHSIYKQIGVFVGPEGGWDETEIAAAQSHNYKIVGLGSPTLRAETAAIIGAYLVANADKF